uniref:Ig-like domain-containing protein n=1 Tax=Cyprinus carpio TaxID=7962 RepID=A0A8C1PZG4_CYPCA
SFLSSSHMQLVLICCQAAVADLLTDLGSNVIINCDLDENEVYWILLKTADPPTVILRSFSTQTKSPFYPNKTFRKKYSVQFKHRLVINNVTADELGVYYCMNTETLPKLSNSTRIYFTGEIYFSGEFIYSCSNLIISVIIYICFLMNLLSIFNLAVFGGSVVLPCSSDEHDLKLQDIDVFWRGKDNAVIYNLIKGADSLDSQDQRYKNRAQTFPDEYKKGNFSIKLVNLTHTDAGKFICYITPSDEQETVQLIIKVTFVYVVAVETVYKQTCDTSISQRCAHCAYMLHHPPFRL